MEQFDKKLREMAEREPVSTPEGFDGRLRDTLDSLPSKGRRRRLGALKSALIAAAACVLLAGTAFAASPGLRDILAEALGGFAPYAQEQEDQTYVIEGIEFKVKSVLADDFTVRAYLEARDVEGDSFDKIDDITIPTRIHGGVGVPTVNEWLATDATEAWTSGVKCLSYDQESRTAFLVASTWKYMPEDMAGVAVEIREFNSYLTGKNEEVWRNHWRRTIPVEAKPVESIVLGKDSALVSGVGAEEARLSPLGVTLIFHGNEVRREASECDPISVKLTDGSVIEVPWSGMCRVFFPPYDKNSSKVFIWNFQEPVEAEQIQGVYVGEDYFPIK